MKLIPVKLSYIYRSGIDTERSIISDQNLIIRPNVVQREIRSLLKMIVDNMTNIFDEDFQFLSDEILKAYVTILRR